MTDSKKGLNSQNTFSSVRYRRRPGTPLKTMVVRARRKFLEDRERKLSTILAPALVIQQAVHAEPFGILSTVRMSTWNLQTTIVYMESSHITTAARAAKSHECHLHLDLLSSTMLPLPVCWELATKDDEKLEKERRKTLSWTHTRHIQLPASILHSTLSHVRRNWSSILSSISRDSHAAL